MVDLVKIRNKKKRNAEAAPAEQDDNAALMELY